MRVRGDINPQTQGELMDGMNRRASILLRFFFDKTDSNHFAIFRSNCLVLLLKCNAFVMKFNFQMFIFV